MDRGAKTGVLKRAFILVFVLATLAACGPIDGARDKATTAASPPAIPTDPAPHLEEYQFSLGFDSIMPVYEPEFAPAEKAPLVDEELVIGVAWQGEAKAYPISVLRFREIVNDELGKTPVLVTW